jgi:DNA anti-recombination protein RmuC
VHDALTVGIPVLVILLGILLNQRGLDKLEARLDGRMNVFEGSLDHVQSDLTGRQDRIQSDLTGRLDRMQSDLTGRLDRMQAELSARLDRMQADLSMFYRTLGEHGAEIDHLKKDRNA